MKIKMKYLMKKEAIKKLKSKLNVFFMSKRSQGTKKVVKNINKIENLRREGKKKMKLKLLIALTDKLHMSDTY